MNSRFQSIVNCMQLDLRQDNISSGIQSLKYFSLIEAFEIMHEEFHFRI